MILCHIWRRNKERRLLCQAQLRNGTSTTARNHHIGNLVGVVHTVDKRQERNALGRIVCEKLAHLILVETTCLPNHLHRGLATECRNPRLHHIVQSTCSERASHNQDCRHSLLQAIVRKGLLAVNAAITECATQRVARVDNLFLIEETLHTVVSHTYALCSLADNLIHKTCIRVLLLDNGRNTHHLRNKYDWCTCITTKASHDIGLKLLDDATCLIKTTKKAIWQRKILPSESALQANNRQALDIVTQLWDKCHLHLALGTDKEDLDILTKALLQRLGNRNCRVNMASGTSSG